jgi:hypothetical protein
MTASDYADIFGTLKWAIPTVLCLGFAVILWCAAGSNQRR